MRFITTVTLAFALLFLLSSDGLTQNPEPVAALTLLLKDENIDVRRAAAYSLKFFPSTKDSRAALIVALGDDDEIVSKNAADAIAVMHPGDAVPALVKASKDPTNTRLRFKAATVMGRFRGYAELAIPDLIMLLRDEDAAVRLAAATSLAKLQGGRWR